MTTGKERAQKALNIYSHIDFLRPFFDVEPKDVLNRLIHSLVPTKNNVSYEFNHLPDSILRAEYRALN